MNGKKLHFKNSKDAMDYSFALVTEERKLNGMFGKDTIQFNTTITNLDSYKTFGVLSNRKMQEAANREIKTMHTKCVSADELISSLSGGNQQKVAISKWMSLDLEVLIMDEPTRGVDVKAKAEIYETMRKLANKGKCIIMISSDLPEILRVSHRVLVMHEGRITMDRPTVELDQEEIMYAALN